MAGRWGKAQELTEQTNLAFLGTETQAFANMNGGGFYAAMDFHHFLLCFMGFFVHAHLSIMTTNLASMPLLKGTL